MRSYSLTQDYYENEKMLKALVDYAQAKNDIYIQEKKEGKYDEAEAEHMLAVIEFRQERIIEKYCK